MSAPASFAYSPWRHGGWYVHDVRYPSGACGCVSRNYPDGKWRIVCDTRPEQPTYKTRDAAARAEYDIAEAAADHRERVIERGRGPSRDELEQINAAIVAADMVAAYSTPDGAP